MFAAMDDVAWQFSQTEGKFAAEVEESADEDQESAEEKKRASKLAKRFHRTILPEPTAKPSWLFVYYHSLPAIDK